MVTHRLRSQEKKIKKKLIWSLIIVVSAAMLTLYVGLPLIAKFAILLSMIKRNTPIEEQQTSVILLPPLLEPLAEATNTAKISIIGFAQNETEVVIKINDIQKAKVRTESNGKFKANNLALVEGENKISAVVSKDNQESSPATTTIFYKKNPPQLEITNPQDGQTITGEESEINIEGSTDPANRITVNGRVVIVETNGTFKYLQNLTEGENKLLIEAFDNAGNKSEKEIKVNYSP